MTLSGYSVLVAKYDREFSTCTTNLMLAMRMMLIARYCVRCGCWCFLNIGKSLPRKFVLVTVLGVSCGAFVLVSKSNFVPEFCVGR